MEPMATLDKGAVTHWVAVLLHNKSALQCQKLIIRGLCIDKSLAVDGSKHSKISVVAFNLQICVVTL